jgi:hypothetical protein
VRDKRRTARRLILLLTPPLLWIIMLHGYRPLHGHGDLDSKLLYIVGWPAVIVATVACWLVLFSTRDQSR